MYPLAMPGTPAASIQILLGLLLNSAFMEEEKRNVAAASTAYGKQEYQDVTLLPGKAAQGVAFFLGAPAKNDGQSVLLQVVAIDIEAATRYVVRIPLSVPSPVGGPGKTN